MFITHVVVIVVWSRAQHEKRTKASRMKNEFHEGKYNFYISFISGDEATAAANERKYET
jgi:hypothetical protein